MHSACYILLKTQARRSIATKMNFHNGFCKLALKHLNQMGFQFHDRKWLTSRCLLCLCVLFSVG